MAKTVNTSTKIEKMAKLTEKRRIIEILAGWRFFRIDIYQSIKADWKVEGKEFTF